jgi:hypothetical protein
MREYRQNDNGKKTVREWSAPEIKEYPAGMHTEGKTYTVKTETMKSYGPS